jgi:hypothetical protein
MRLIIAQYLKTLRERAEFDRLLPELLLAMGYTVLSKPQAGNRQHGVDFSAVGISPEDGVKEVLMFVIKQGDLERSNWDTREETSVRPSIQEVLDVYIPTHLATEYQELRKNIIVAITGERKQTLDLNWAQFINSHETDTIKIKLWNGFDIAALLEQYLLDEHLFDNEDRLDLRKTLALAADNDYDFSDYKRLLRRQLGLDKKGSLIGSQPPVSTKDLEKAIRRVNLASQMCVQWAQAENTKQALWISEQTLLWTWHRVWLCEKKEQKKLRPALEELFIAHDSIQRQYLAKILPHCMVKDGLAAGYSHEGGIFSLVLFEHLGYIAIAGLHYLFLPSMDEPMEGKRQQLLDLICDQLLNVINNNPASASPRLDRHIVDISLALIFLLAMGKLDETRAWLRDIAKRLDWCYTFKQYFPISTDSVDDLAELRIDKSDRFVSRMMSTSWALATIGGFCALLQMNDAYMMLAEGQRKRYAKVCAQFWFPGNDWAEKWYYHSVVRENGYTDPIGILPQSSQELLTRMEQCCSQPLLTRQCGNSILDLMACRHYQMPVPMFLWRELALTLMQSAELTNAE